MICYYKYSNKCFPNKRQSLKNLELHIGLAQRNPTGRLAKRRHIPPCPFQSIVTLAFFTTCAMRAASLRKKAAAGSGGVSLIS